MEHFLSPRYSPLPMNSGHHSHFKRKSRDNLPRVIWTKPEFEPQFLDFPPPLLPIATHYGWWSRVYGMCVKTSQARPACLVRLSAAQLTAWSFLPDPAKESIQGLKALMALIGRERKDMSTEGKTQALAPVCMEVMLSAGMDEDCGTTAWGWIPGWGLLAI